MLNSLTNLSNISEEDIKGANNIANNIYLMNNRSKDNLKIIDTDFSNTNININSNIKESYLFLDISSSVITIDNKVNHLIFRNCSNCNINIKGSVSGIDFIKCSYLNILSDNYIYLDINASSNLNFVGHLDQSFEMLIGHSLDIFINSHRYNNVFGNTKYNIMGRTINTTLIPPTTQLII